MTSREVYHWSFLVMWPCMATHDWVIQWHRDMMMWLTSPHGDDGDPWWLLGPRSCNNHFFANGWGWRWHHSLQLEDIKVTSVRVCAEGSLSPCCCCVSDVTVWSSGYFVLQGCIISFIEIVMVSFLALVWTWLSRLILVLFSSLDFFHIKALNDSSFKLCFVG